MNSYPKKPNEVRASSSRPVKRLDSASPWAQLAVLQVEFIRAAHWVPCISPWPCTRLWKKVAVFWAGTAWYLDDGKVFGSLSTLNTLPRLGLTLSKKKWLVATAGGVAGFTYLEGITLVDLRQRGTGFRGCPDFVKSELEKVLSRAESFCKNTELLDIDRRCCFFCGCAVAPAEWCTFYGVSMVDLADRPDMWTMTTCWHIAGFPLSPAQKVQFHLLGKGGLGVQSAVAVLPVAAFVGCWRFFLEGQTTLALPAELTQDWGEFPAQELSALCDALPPQCCWLAEHCLPSAPEEDWLNRSGGWRR